MVSMKKIATVAAVIVFILLLTKIANQAPQEQLPGIAFSLKAQRVVKCSSDEITLVDAHDVLTHLYKGGKWPDCSTFHDGEVLDFYLSNGEKTYFLRDEETAWWRKAM